MKHSQPTDPQRAASSTARSGSDRPAHDRPSEASPERAADGRSPRSRALRSGLAALAVAVAPAGAAADANGAGGSTDAPAQASPPDVAAGIGIASNLLYKQTGGDPKNKDRLDIYQPVRAEGADASELAPVIVFIHGGGLVDGDKQLYARLGQYLAANGYVAVIPNHRLSPDVMHPAHVEDIAEAFAWTHANVEEYGGDPDRIVVTGHSAGAYLAGLLALDPRYLAAHGLTNDTIKGVVPISGFYHVERLAEERPKSVWGTDRQVWLEASPSRYVRPDAPPMLLLYAEDDTEARRQESRDLVEELRAEGHASITSEQIDDRNHVSIIRRFGSDGDPTAAKLLEFSARVLRQD